MLRTSSRVFTLCLSLADMQGADVAISVSHCDYMLTNHLHDDQHLCRYIDEIRMCWAIFLYFFSAGNPAFVSHSSDGDFGCVPFRGKFMLCVLAKSPDPRSAFTSFLSSSSAITSWPTDQLWHSLPVRVRVSKSWKQCLAFIWGLIKVCLELCCVPSLSSSGYRQTGHAHYPTVNYWNFSFSTNVWWPSDWSKKNIEEETAVL